MSLSRVTASTRLKHQKEMERVQKRIEAGKDRKGAKGTSIETTYQEYELWAEPVFPSFDNKLCVIRTLCNWRGPPYVARQPYGCTSNVRERKWTHRVALQGRGSGIHREPTAPQEAPENGGTQAQPKPSKSKLCNLNQPSQVAESNTSLAPVDRETC